LSLGLPTASHGRSLYAWRRVAARESALALSLGLPTASRGGRSCAWRPVEAVGAWRSGELRRPARRLRGGSRFPFQWHPATQPPSSGVRRGHR
jgi:hypothetical protein